MKPAPGRYRQLQNAARRAALSEPFSIEDSREYAERTLAGPPAFPWIDRVTPAGELVARFVLPNSLCIPRNRDRDCPPWLKRAIRQSLLDYLQMQLISESNKWGDTTQRRKQLPLDGRPTIVVVRFSSSRSDAGCDGAKTAIDCLCKSRLIRTKKGVVTVPGLGLLRGDGPRDVQRPQPWWEPAPRGKGFTLIDVLDEPRSAER
jgi:hypothetical protein